MKIPRKEKRPLALLFWTAYLTGATLFVLSHWVRVETAIGAQHHPAEHWTRVVHTSLTYLLVAGLGFLGKGHVLPGLKRDKRKRSGLAALGLAGLVVGSAVVVLYAGGDEGPGLAAWIHGLLGLAVAPLVLLHKRQPKRREMPAAARAKTRSANLTRTVTH